MKTISYFLVLGAILGIPVKTIAQGWSYLYIQGDKLIPFYVKLEGEMLPRYSKNYYIIPQLAAGPVQLEILFQQNQYPAQKFNILVPDQGHRGFLLTQKENSFALYDVQQKFFLMPGVNGEDHLPEIVAVKKTEVAVKKTEKQLPVTGKQAAVVQNETITAEQVFKPGGNDPKFLSNIVLENDRNATPPEEETEKAAPLYEPAYEAAAVPRAVEEEHPDDTGYEYNDAPEETSVAESAQNSISFPTPNTTYNIANEQAVEEVPVSKPEAPVKQKHPEKEASAAIQPAYNSPDYESVERETKKKSHLNPECPEAIGESDFDKIYNSVKKKDDDEDRIALLMKLAKTNCYTTQQVYFLAREVSAESMRYTFLKKVYPKISDQHNFRQLENHLFKTLEWKSYFRLISQ